MLRKWLAVLAALLVLGLTASAVAEEPDSLMSRAIALAIRMNTSTRDTAYLNSLAAGMGDSDKVIALARQWGEGHENLPIMVVQTNEESELIKLLVRQTILSEGIVTYAATTMMETVTIFAADGVQDGAYVMIYEGEVPILVVWHGEEGAVRMRAMYLPFADLAACTTNREVADWFAAHGMEQLSITEADTAPVVASEPSGADLFDWALYAALTLDALADDEVYCASLGASDELVTMIKEWAQGDAGDPVLAVKTDLSLESPGIQFLNEVLLPEFEVDEPMVAKAVNALPTLLLGRYCGTEQLAASGMIRGEILFANSEGAMTGLFLLIYEEKTPIMVASYAREGAVNMRAYYLPIDALAGCRTVREVNDFFEDVLLPMTWELAESSRQGED